MEVKEDFHVVDENQHISITLRYDLLKLPHQPYELLLSIHVVLHNLLTSAPPSTFLADPHFLPVSPTQTI